MQKDDIGFALTCKNSGLLKSGSDFGPRCLHTNFLAAVPIWKALSAVINLRLKTPGSFWLKDMAGSFLFLCSQLLSGPWEIIMTNLTVLTSDKTGVLPGLRG